MQDAYAVQIIQALQAIAQQLQQMQQALSRVATYQGRQSCG
jgi:hypothetical protein